MHSYTEKCISEEQILQQYLTFLNQDFLNLLFPSPLHEQRKIA